jgi:peptide/nickel transport system substrate-binding protein
LDVGKNSGYSRAISTSVIVVILIVLIVAGVVAYYYAFPAPSPTTTTTSSSSSSTSSSSTTSTTTSSSVGYKNTLILGTTDKVQTTIDPADAYDYFGINMIDNLGAGLIDFAPGTTNTSPANLQPALATKWSASSDGLTYTFILRSGLKYDDGTPFNSTDVKFSVNRGLAIYDPNGAFNGLTIDQIIGSITTPNATAVVFHLKAPFSAFLNMMTFGIFYPVNPHRVPWPLTCKAPCNDASGIVNFTANNPTASNPNGLGPYTLTEWTRSGVNEVEMTLTANPNYWNYPAYPKTHTIIIKFYSTPTALAAAIRSGDVDIAYRQFATTDIQSMMTASGLHVYSSPGAFIQYLVFNQKAGAPYNDINVRQGIAAALNRTDLSDTVFAGTATPLYSQIPLGMGYHIDAFKTAYGAGPNYTLAKTLLAKSGYSATNKLKITLWYETTGHYPQSPDQALVIAHDLEASGVISVTLTGVDFTTLHSDVRAGSVTMFIYGWYPDFIDPYDYTTPFFSSTGASWLNDGYNSTTMDGLLAQSITATGTQLASVYTQIQNLQAHDVPIIPVYQGGSNCCGAIAKTTVGGVYLDVTLIFRLYTLYETTS